MSLQTDLYKEVIIEHSANPRGKKRLNQPTHALDARNPLCGDECHLELRMDGGVIQDIGITGEGCSISKASASLLTETVRGLKTDEARALVTRLKGMLIDGNETAFDDELEDLQALSGVRQYPVRIKCATLAWNTLEQAMQEIQARTEAENHS